MHLSKPNILCADTADLEIYYIHPIQGLIGDLMLVGTPVDFSKTCFLFVFLLLLQNQATEKD